ncbi:hypothetical protein M5689_019831 [Euphorbia peplus]|nr:hypothetical protein M5689_019831 [Euphorbia peplus]
MIQPRVSQEQTEAVEKQIEDVRLESRNEAHILRLELRALKEELPNMIQQALKRYGRESPRREGENPPSPPPRREPRDLYRPPINPRDPRVNEVRRRNVNQFDDFDSEHDEFWS